MPFKIFVTRPIPDQGIKMLKDKKYSVSIYPKDEIIPRKALLKGVRGVEALLPILTDKIDEEVLKAAGPQLKIVANYAVGFDNVDVDACKKRNIMLTNAPGPEIVQSVAEHTFALIIALAHRIVESDKFIRAGKYHGWGPQLLLGTDVYGKTLGIIGLGRIGFAVADRATGFKMKILYNDPKPNPDFEKNYGARFAQLPKLLREADFVTLHVPLLPSTRHLISTPQLILMKPTAFLINTARGPIVDENTLLQALKNKKIAGAGLDVYEHEPKLTRGFAKLENVILTPHTASATVETRQAMSRTAAENIIAAFSGKTPPNLVQ